MYNLKKSESLYVFDSRYVYDYQDSTFIKITLYDDMDTTKGNLVYNLLTDKSMFFENNNDFEIWSNYIIDKKDGKETYYNTDLKQIYVANN